MRRSGSPSRCVSSRRSWQTDVEVASRRVLWLGRLTVVAGLLAALALAGLFFVSRADGPVFVFAGGPLRSGPWLDFAQVDWETLDALNELEMEIVGIASSRTLWFSVHEGVPYVGCDLDCVGGRLTRWPQQIARDDRVVIRIDGRRVSARLAHVPHGTQEYLEARARREGKYAGDAGGRAAAETAAHHAVVSVGETLTGRDRREEQGDRLYRVNPGPRPPMDNGERASSGR